MSASPFVKICTYITIDEHFIIQAFPASKSAHKLLGDIPILVYYISKGTGRVGQKKSQNVLT